MRTILLAMIFLGLNSLEAQVSKKELDDVKFENFTDERTGTMYGFSYNGNPIGPAMTVKSDGTIIITYFNEDNLGEGFQMIENKNSGVKVLHVLKDNVQHGNAFKIIGNQLQWAQSYKNGEIHRVKEIPYTNKQSNRNGCIGDCLDGFGMYKTSGDQIVWGYFKNSNPETPVIHIFPSESMYQGEMNKWERDGFGKYSYANDGSYYVGMWKKNLRHGLGIWFNKDGSIKQKGYFKKDELVKNM